MTRRNTSGTNQRKPAPTLTVIYQIEQDPTDRRWNVARGGVPTGAFARDKATAIGQAYAAASKEAHDTNMNVQVWSVQGGKRVKEWQSHAK